MLLFSLSLALAYSPVCPKQVSELPSSPLYSSGDKRLQRQDLIVAIKSERLIMRFKDGILVDNSCWRTGLGMGGHAGPKSIRGDLKTPEGWYRTSDKPWSRYYGAIAVHYPNADDAALGELTGRISADQRRAILASIKADEKPPQNTKLGGEILIHGGGGGSDWTLGCLAMYDEDIDALRASLPRDQVATILILH